MAIYALKTLSHIVIDSGDNCSPAPKSAYFLTIKFDKTRHKIIANNYVKLSSIFLTDAKYADNKYKSIEWNGHLIFVKQDQHCNKVEGCFQYLCRHLFWETRPSYLQSIISIISNYSEDGKSQWGQRHPELRSKVLPVTRTGLSLLIEFSAFPVNRLNLCPVWISRVFK